MRVTIIFLLFGVTTFVFALATDLEGCHLVVPEEVKKQPEPKPETGPLLLHVAFKISDIRDVPASGGYFGVDLTKVSND